MRLTIYKRNPYDRVLFEHEAADNTWRVTVEAALAARCEIADSNLQERDMSGLVAPRAKLRKITMAGSNLHGADFRGADMVEC